MPLITLLEQPHYRAGVWKIEEEPSFFDCADEVNHIRHPQKRLQWYAARHVAGVLSVNISDIHNDEYGKPYIPGSQLQISLTHTAHYAAAIVSETHRVGIDLEWVHPRVQRVAHKFLTAEEIAAINRDEFTEKLIVYWSAKESLYKLYGRKGISFTSQLQVQPFDLDQKGKLIAAIKTADVMWDNLEVEYRFIYDHVLTYVCRIM
ncbi:MAG: 4'-phosphopantetheinyl transferase superfamily protein [Chitinophagales bacterium]|nr:4'-phosphopantetheinyl transferase superfamily protein [Chitinophagales bacterium]MDW8420018.1 4'-phosphopantetheinyl transferase superfamily protein [Chitinophagales bacterium]